MIPPPGDRAKTVPCSVRLYRNALPAAAHDWLHRNDRPFARGVFLPADDDHAARNQKRQRIRQQFDATLLVRTVDQHLPIEAPCAAQRWIENLGAVGRGEEDDADRGVEAVQLA